MRKSVLFLLAALLIGTGLGYAGQNITLEDKIKAGSLPRFQRQKAEYVPDEVMIKFRDNVTYNDLNMFQDQMGVQAATRHEAIAAFYQGYGVQLKRKTSLGWDRVKLKPGQNVKDVIAQVKKNPLVEKVEPNYRVYAAALSTTYTATGSINDTYYADGTTAWWFNRTQADQAYDANYVFEGTGDVIVAVVDTGVNLTHTEFAGRLVSGWDFVNSDADPTDDNDWIGSVFVNGHGTHVAGLIAAAINNTSGIAGTAWKAQIKIMPIKVLDSLGGGTLSDLANGINYAITNGAVIINASVSAPVTSGELATAVTNANNQGRVLIAAAGNGNTNIAKSYSFIYPAVYSTVISVGAVSSDDYITIYSNYSDPAGMIDCVAPGGSLSSIFSGILYDNDYGVTSTARDGAWSAVDGTSFAAPQVAALAAMLKLQVPSRTHNDIRTLITNNCDTVGGGAATLYGAGRINVLRALGIYQTVTPSHTPTITPTSTHSPTSTPSPTITYTSTISPTSTHSPTMTLSPTITYTSTISPTSTPSSTITQTSTITPTSTISPTTTPIGMTRDEIKVFPQPGKDIIRVAFDTTGQVETRLSLYNLVGERVLKIENQTPVFSGATGILTIDTNAIGSGIYYLVLTVNDDQAKRVMKQKVVIAK